MEAGGLRWNQAGAFTEVAQTDNVTYPFESSWRDCFQIPLLHVTKHELVPCNGQLTAKISVMAFGAWISVPFYAVELLGASKASGEVVFQRTSTTLVAHHGPRVALYLAFFLDLSPDYSSCSLICQCTGSRSAVQALLRSVPYALVQGNVVGEYAIRFRNNTKLSQSSKGGLCIGSRLISIC